MPSVREQIEELWQEHVVPCYELDEVSDMWEWLCEGDYFTAPASARFHNSNEGGLAAHSLVVTIWCKKLAEAYLETHPDCEDEHLVDRAVTCGILHDACKVGLYSLNDGSDPEKPKDKWKYVPDKEQVRRHGTLSRKIVYEHMPHIGAGELDAIEWHMGPYDARLKMPDSTKLSASRLVKALDKLNQAQQKHNAARWRSPLVDIVHLADSIAANVVEEDDWREAIEREIAEKRGQQDEVKN